MLDGKIWIALGSLGEYQWRGHGFQVYDYRTGSLLFKEGSKSSYLINDFVKNIQSSDIELATEDGLISIDSKNYQVKKIYQIIAEFNLKTELPEFYFAEKEKRDNPFARLAFSLSFNENKTYYRKILPILNEAVDSKKINSITASELEIRNDVIKIIFPMLNDESKNKIFNHLLHDKGLQESLFVIDSSELRRFKNSRPSFFKQTDGRSRFVFCSKQRPVLKNYTM